MSSATAENRANNNSAKMESPKRENGIIPGLLRLWPLAPRQSTPSSPVGEDSSTIYYGVYVPFENEDPLHIYTERLDALKIVKKYKQARFKAFKNRQQAVAFALQGAESTSADKIPADGPSLVLNTEKSSDNGKRAASPVVGEQPSQFKGPKPQDMVKLRKDVESGSLTTVRDTVWENPRYLVSSGDTPAILHEGTRYNALHIAAKSGNAEMCNFVLSTVGDPAFIKLLYGEENIQMCKDRAAVLMDLYINTPDKAMNDTPLHLAVKFGFADVVDLLISYPQCNKQNRNKFGYLPKDVVCERAKSSDAATAARIRAMLSERFYVPVIHSEGDCNQPQIGVPFNPISPPLLNTDPLSPRQEIRAYAGPMPKQEADSFRKKWKTPPRQLRQSRFRLTDVDKGLEKYGRNLAQELNVGWKEYWPFLDTFTDLSSSDGLKLLEEYFKNKYSAAYSQVFSDTMHDSLLEYEDLNISEEVVRKLSFSKVAKEELLSPVSDLCQALQACALGDTSKPYARRRVLDYPKETVQPSKQPSNEESFVNPSLSPFLCMERSCQVFAKRMADSLIYALSSDMDSLEDTIKSETKHLQQTVASYMDDSRFLIVDFKLIHSRVAQLTASRVKLLAECEEDLSEISKHLSNLAASSRSDEMLSSDEDDNIPLYRQNNVDRSKKLTQAMAAHFRCLSEKIAANLDDKSLKEICSSIKSEDESMAAWSELEECRCSWQVGFFNRKDRKNASFKRNHLKSLADRNERRLTYRCLQFQSDNDGNPDSPVKHCLTILPNSVDKNHNTAVIGTSQSRDEICHQSSEIEDISNRVPKVSIDEFENVDASGDDVLSDDESNVSSDDASIHGDDFYTPPSTPNPEIVIDDDGSDCASVMLDVSDDGAVDVFIYGDAPSKADRDVFEAITMCNINCETYPNLFKWRHNINLYQETERMSWQAAIIDSPDGIVEPCHNLGRLLSMRCSTPIRTKARMKAVSPDLNRSSSPSLEVSKWLRITGANSPKSALASPNRRANVSLAF